MQAAIDTVTKKAGVLVVDGERQTYRASRASGKKARGLQGVPTVGGDRIPRSPMFHDNAATSV